MLWPDHRIPGPFVRKLLVRLTITILLCWLVFGSVDYGAFRDVLARSSVGMLAIALALIFVIRIIMASRWYLILRSLGVETRLASVLRITLVSQSLGYLLPSSAGADLVRIQQIRTESAKLRGATSSVLLDRLLGTASMLLVTLVAALFDLAGPNATGHGTLIAFLSSGGLLALALLMLAWPPVWRRIAGLHMVRRLPSKLTGFVAHVTGSVTDRHLLKLIAKPVLSLSIVVQISRAVVFFLLFAAVGHDVAFVYCLIFIPLVFVIVMVPLTIGGLGLREGSMAYLFLTVGVPAEASVAAGLAYYLLGLVVLLPGFALFLLGRERHGIGAGRPKAGERA